MAKSAESSRYKYCAYNCGACGPIGDREILEWCKIKNKSKIRCVLLFALITHMEFKNHKSDQKENIVLNCSTINDSV